MHSLKTILHTNRLFYIALVFISITGLCFNNILSIPMYATHPVWLNIFFINYSFMGDGLFAIALAAWYFFYLKKKQTGLMLFCSFIFCESIVQLIKNLFSNGAFKFFFEKGQYLFFADEAELANFHSFPSGHTAVAFAISTVLILMSKNKKWQLFFLPAAILLGISRMYLAQNSIAELVTGAFIGSTSGLLVFYFAKSAGSFKLPFKKPRLFNHVQQHSTTFNPQP